MKLTNKDKVLLGLGLVLLIATFMFGRVSKKTPVQIKQTDVSSYVRAIDNLKSISKKRADTILLKNKIIARQNQVFDSLTHQLTINHKNTSNAVNAIKKFNTISRNRFADSVARANGF